MTEYLYPDWVVRASGWAALLAAVLLSLSAIYLVALWVALLRWLLWERPRARRRARRRQ